MEIAKGSLEYGFQRLRLFRESLEDRWDLWTMEELALCRSAPEGNGDKCSRDCEQRQWIPPPPSDVSGIGRSEDE